jgi:hypothetical protein
MDREMLERVRNVLLTLTRYRSRHLDDARIEEIVTQLEAVQSVIESEGKMSREQKNALNFNLIEGTPLESNETLATELQSIRNFAMNAL